LEDDDSYSETDKEYHQTTVLSDQTYQIINDYILLNTIGKGTTGKVKHCINISTGKEYAIKICNKKNSKKKRNLSKSNYDELRREIQLMKNLNHSNIVRLYRVIDDPDSNFLYMVMEYMEGGSVMEAKLGEPLSEDVAKAYFTGILDAVQYLHSMNIIHRDIKPAKYCRNNTKPTP